jgi:A/G-specific adenine glycosylase
MKHDKIVNLMVEWFQRKARDLPWRRTRDPYSIWVSEIMLQQTQVKTVIPFWNRWMIALPTIRSLARAKPEKIHKLWEGLGYYTRVRNMQKAAQVILDEHGGRFPANFDQVLELPGIGRYTAGAICSIAYNQPCAILDGNVIRVLCRVFAIDGNPRDKVINTKLWELAESLVKHAEQNSNVGARAGRLSGKIANRKSQIKNPQSPMKHAGRYSNLGALPSLASQKIANRKSQIKNPLPLCSHFNQSLMELGALVCTPREPRCGECPLVNLCIARKQGRVEQLPFVAPRPPVTRRRFVAFVAQREAEVLVQQRPAGVVNAHLWEFPNIEVPTENGDPQEAARQVFGICQPGLAPLCTIHHSITRYRIRLDVFELGPGDPVARESNNGRWVKKDDLDRLAFASAHKKILTHFAEPPPSS